MELAHVNAMIHQANLPVSNQQWTDLFGYPSGDQTLGANFWPAMMRMATEQRGAGGAYARFNSPVNFSRANAFRPLSLENARSGMVFPCIFWRTMDPEIMEMRCVHIIVMNSRTWRVHASWLEVHLPALPAPMSETLDNGATLTYLIPAEPDSDEEVEV